MKAKIEGSETVVRALITHAMETGLRKDSKTGEKIPAHHITEINCEHNGKNVLLAQWGPSVSQNPYLSFKFAGAKAGDKVKLTWVDNKGETDSAEATIG
ncbi:MAG TPA: thiosulfate oxidation carrier complex protein SoxZ [Gammaproteobacteria bacterium]